MKLNPGKGAGVENCCPPTNDGGINPNPGGTMGGTPRFPSGIGEALVTVNRSTLIAIPGGGCGIPFG